ncbi:MAG TPA: SMP-30/gluconolactonase/LRE family protein [Candidatus Acidoferrales bacterium]|nr:SMP-30/gluconolactonase/LRE family protein [Candidatus Acidoferrales bacterium]
MTRRLLAALALALLPLAALGVTVTTPGTVTTVVNSKLFTAPSGDNRLHGIVRDPVSGDIYVGDWNQLSVGVTPFFGPYIENKDSIRRIDQLQEVSLMTYVVAPNAMAYNAADREIYVVAGSVSCNSSAPRGAGPSLNGIVAIDPATGKSRVLAGGKPGSANGSAQQARFEEPAGIASDPGSGAFFVSEGCMNRIREVDANGDVATLAGSGQKGSNDGAGDQAQFDDPRGLAYCEHEHLLYVADSSNNEIRSIDLNGNVKTLAGAPEPGFVDGSGSAARFDEPTGVACDNAGNVYVADSENNAVRMITAAGVVTTLAGDKTPGTADGVGTAARFSTPGDLTYDPDATALYVVDWGSNKIRKVSVPAPAGSP